MKVDVIIADEGDRAHVVHLLECPEHGQEFVDELLQLLMKAAASPELPAVAMFISMELFHDPDDVNNITGRMARSSHRRTGSVVSAAARRSMPAPRAARELLRICAASVFPGRRP